MIISVAKVLYTGTWLYDYITFHINIYKAKARLSISCQTQASMKTRQMCKLNYRPTAASLV